jgi:hypothetical protein
MAPDDPNLDPTWDWTVSGPGHTMYYSDNGSTPIALYNVQVPFYTSGHPLADAASNDDKDMWPQDGWVLAYRDFGTPTSAPAFPFFALYNKYRGTFRVMIYNAPGIVYSGYKMALSFRSSSPKSALFTFTDPDYPYLEDYDAGKTEIFVGRVSPYQDWAFGDFSLVGYDPSLDPGAILHLEFDGIDESTLTLASTQFTLNELLDQANPAGGKPSGSSNVLAALNSGARTFQDIVEFKKALQDSLNDPSTTPPTPSSPWWANLVRNFVSSGVATVAPFVGAVLGIVTSFIGGKDKAAPREPIHLTGSLKLSGSITITRPSQSIDLALFSGPLAPDYYRPVQTIPWGVFNLHRVAWQFDSGHEECIWVQDPYDPDQYDEQCSIVQNPLGLTSVDYLFNPDLDITLTSGTGGLTGCGMTPRFGAPMTRYPLWQLPSLNLPLSCAGVEFTYRINHPTKNSASEIVVDKLYPIRSVVVE